MPAAGHSLALKLHKVRFRLLIVDPGQLHCRVYPHIHHTDKQKNDPLGRFFVYGGDGGVRTPDTVARIRDFESRAFNQLCHISVRTEIIHIKKTKANKL